MISLQTSWSVKYLNYVIKNGPRSLLLIVCFLSNASHKRERVSDVTIAKFSSYAPGTMLPFNTLLRGLACSAISVD